MLEKLLDKYIESKLPDRESPVSDNVDNHNNSAPIGSGEKKPKLEKKILSIFGILLQLIVFYLPLMNMIFRGKQIPGILS